MVSLLDKMTIWKERILRSIPLWATLFMVSVMIFIDVAILHRLEFLLAAIPIVVIIGCAVIIAFVRPKYFSQEGEST